MRPLRGGADVARLAPMSAWNVGQRALCSCEGREERPGVVVSGSRRGAPTVQVDGDAPHPCATARRAGGVGRPSVGDVEIIRLGGRALEIARAGAERDQLTLREWVEKSLKLFDS